VSYWQLGVWFRCGPQATAMPVVSKDGWFIQSPAASCTLKSKVSRTHIYQPPLYPPLSSPLPSPSPPHHQTLLKELSASVSDLSERLDGQASLSAQPEALRSRLQETGEVRSELEGRRAQLAEAGRLCEELSDIVAEPYLREELSKRLEAVGAPLRSLEERAGGWREGWW